MPGPLYTGTADGDYELAKQRIQRARDAGSTSLSLASLYSLEDLPPLDGLNTIRSLKLNGTKIANLAGIESAANLRELWLGEHVSNIEQLRRLTRLTQLVAHCGELRNIKALASLPLLRRLYASSNYVDDITPLSKCPQLQEAYLQFSKLENIDAFAAVSSLTNISLSRAKVGDISPLKNHVALRQLTLTDCPIEDISPVAGLTRLRVIDLAGTSVSDLSSLASLEHLWRLNLAKTGVSSVEFAREYRRLEKLNLSGSKVRDLSPLVETISLVSTYEWLGLEFADCPIDDEIVRSFAALENPERTSKTLNYLRQQVGLPPVDSPTAESSPSTSLEQRPAPFQFAWKDDKLVANATIGSPLDTPFVSEMLSELRKKCLAAREKLVGNHADGGTIEAVAAFEEVIADSAAQIRVGVLLMRFRTLESEARSYQGSSAHERSVRATISDLAASAEDLLTQFPAIRQIDAQREALRFQADAADLIMFQTYLSEIATAAANSSVVDASAVDALLEGTAQIELLTQLADTAVDEDERADAIEKRAQIAGFQALDLRNFTSAPLKRLAEEVGPVGSATWKELKQAIPRGVGAGVESAISSSVKVGVATLIGAIAGPLIGVGALIASFMPIGRRAKEIQQELTASESE